MALYSSHSRLRFRADLAYAKNRPINITDRSMDIRHHPWFRLYLAFPVVSKRMRP